MLYKNGAGNPSIDALINLNGLEDFMDNIQKSNCGGSSSNGKSGLGK